VRQLTRPGVTTGGRDQVLNEVALLGVVVLAALLCVPRNRWVAEPARTNRGPAHHR
jgi:hypothetical protein